MDRSFVIAGLVLLMGTAACAPIVPAASSATQPTLSTEAPITAPATQAASDTPAPATAPVTAAIPVTGHLMKPAEPIAGKQVTDVQSSGSSALFGDSYKINRFERPFLQDMTYIPALDIVSFRVGEDADWVYASIDLSGGDPNNSLGIQYGIELDLNADGFGDYLIWAHPPYQTEWDTSTVRVFQDTNHDTAGRSAKESDAGFGGNGYDRQVFDGGATSNDDPDLAWVRIQAGPPPVVQFAFKKSWLGDAFMIGAVSDAGLKDAAQFDYSDHFKEAEAGSPVANSQYYPLGKLFAVDNTCWEANGAVKQGFEPKFCPAHVLPTPTRRPAVGKTATSAPASDGGPTACEEPEPGYCGDLVFNPKTCQCEKNPNETQPPEETQPPVVTQPPEATQPPDATQPPEPPPPPDATQPPEATPPPAAP